MTWLALRAEIEAEMRALSEYELPFRVVVLEHQSSVARRRAKLGPKKMWAAYAARRQKESTEERIAEAHRNGDIRRARMLESKKRAAKRRKVRK